MQQGITEQRQRSLPAHVSIDVAQVAGHGRDGARVAGPAHGLERERQVVPAQGGERAAQGEKNVPSTQLSQGEQRAAPHRADAVAEQWQQELQGAPVLQPAGRSRRTRIELQR